jgi:acetate kinase
VCAAAGWLGIEIDEDANQDGGPNIGIGSGRTSVVVIPTNEDLMIARHALDTVRGGAAARPTPRHEPLRIVS